MRWVAKHRFGLLTLLISLFGLFLAAAIPNQTFTPSTPISSLAFQQNFQDIESRLAALEALPARVTALEQRATPGLDCYIKGADANVWNATCAGGYTLTGGGCNVIDKSSPYGIKLSYPSGNAWTCDANVNLAGAYAVCCKTNVSPPFGTSICRGFNYAKQDYVSRTGYNWADTWMMSWAADGKTYTNFSDGKLSAGSPKVSNAILTIDDDLPNLTATSFHPVSQDPLGVTTTSTWAYYIINTIFVGQTMYVGIVDFDNNGGIAASVDSGQTLLYDHGTPMWPASGPKRFVYPSFLQNGQGYTGNTDGFMYIYGTDGNWGASNTVRIARAPTNADLRVAANYAYYTSTGWSSDLGQAANILGPSEDLGGMQSIVYNPVLDRYFLISFGDTTNNPNPAHMTVFDAPNPWGPFAVCGTITRQAAIFKDIPNQATEIYNPSFNAKWIESDGSMWISYSSCCEDTQYTFQYGKITVTR
jgi:hypothetical protein